MLGIGAYSDDIDAGRLPGSFPDEVTAVVVESDDTETDDSLVARVDSVGLDRLAFEAERRMVGVRSDSRALGSSRVVYFPIAGRVYTCQCHRRQVS